VLQTPLAILLTLTAIAAAIPYALRPVAQVVAPLCWIPGISSSFICSMRAHTPGEDAWSVQYADYPRMIEMQSRTLEQLLDEKAGGSSLALEIKKAEMATTDLITLVKFSELQSKELIAETLTSFVEDARKTGDDLQRLGAKVGGTVDNIMAVNDHALHTIESAQSKSASSLVARVLWPLGGGDSGTKAVVRTTFDHAMSVMDDALQRVVVEAQVSQGDLLVLEERLNTLHEIVHRENGSIAGDREELLAQLWTWLGGNKDKLRKYERHLRLLRGVGAYRKRALAHVVATLQTLHGMKADMEELRARVAAVPIGGDKIPVEVHIKSIQYGLERLKEGRARARQVEEDAIRKVLAIQD
ncbi:hypothetical protein PUNSTDRAFT_65969, partial [Punctularia strigosozonata HHB-11173 SS5]|uniref:uncharacterized protein n=1 Tax=Punctularia strigosozonata (strain HHB-11173) TaxID=741275 RepID=UPI00044170E8